MDSYTEASVKQQNQNSPFTFPYVSRIINVNLPVVEIRNGKLTNLTDNDFYHNDENNYNHNHNHNIKNGNGPPAPVASDQLEYESVRSQELEFRTEDSSVGETSNLPKVAPYVRKYVPTVPAFASTPKFSLKFTTTTAKTDHAPVSENSPFRDNFRIIVEPVTSTKNSTLRTRAPLAEGKKYTATATTKQATRSALATKANASFAPPHPQHQSRGPGTTAATAKSTTPTIANETKSTTAAPAPIVAANDKLYNRRFYIPKTNSLERKLQFGPAVASVGPSGSGGAGIPRTDSSSPSLTQPTITKHSTGYSENSARPSSTEKAGATNNELLYYDDDDDEDEYEDDDDIDESDRNVDSNYNNNYIDNKIVDYFSTTAKSATNAPISPRSTTPTLTTTSTALHDPISFPTQNPYEFVKNRLKETQISGKRTQRPKETNAERCPQCNEKPYVR